MTTAELELATTNNTIVTLHQPHSFRDAHSQVKHVKRLTVNLGYSITSVDGIIPQLNILFPLGSSQYKYYQTVNMSMNLD